MFGLNPLFVKRLQRWNLITGSIAVVGGVFVASALIAIPLMPVKLCR
jgi:hypothetical protein